MRKKLISVIVAILIGAAINMSPVIHTADIPAVVEASSGSIYENEVRNILSGMSRGWSKEEKLLYLHDYLVTHTQYDQTYQRHSAYNAIVDHKAVCQGYAEAYADLAKRAGIQAVVITSRYNNHAWNAVNLNNNWYYVDCTFDDPIGPSDPLFCSHDNFLRNEAGMRNTNHRGNDWVIGHWGQKVNGKYKSRTYENAYWRNAEKYPFTFMSKGVAFYVYKDKAIYTYNCNKGKCNQLVKDDRLGEMPSIVNVADDLFISGGRDIFKVKKNTKKLSLIRRLTDSEAMSGIVVGLEVTGKTLRYDIGSVYVPYFYKPSVERSSYMSTSRLKEISDASIELDKDLINLTQAGGSETIKATTKAIKKVEWKSDNSSVATVSNGTVTAVGDGTCRITAGGDGVSASCIVRVRLPEAEAEEEESGSDSGAGSSSESAGATEHNSAADPADSAGAGTEAEAEAEADAVIPAIPDTTWQEDFTYHVDDDHINISYYHGGVRDLVIPAKAVVRGKEYRTYVSYNLIYPGGYIQAADTVETISFEKGVKIVNSSGLVRDCKKLKSIDLRGCDTSDITHSFYVAYGCPKLETINMRGLDLSGISYFSLYSECPMVRNLVTPGYLSPSVSGYLTDGDWRTKGKDGWNTEKYSYIGDAPANTGIYKYDVVVKKNSRFTRGGITYKVTNTAGTVKVVKITGKKAVIPDCVVYNGARYLVTAIDKKAAAGNKSLKTLTIGAAVKTIGNSAFDGCSGLANIKVSSGVISKVGANAFRKVPAGIKLTVPADRKSFYAGLFKNAGFPANGKIK